MFVKFVRPDSESIYECNYIHTRTQEENDGCSGGKYIYYEIERPSDAVTLKISDVENVSVYLMNDKGQTVETLRVAPVM